jgi:hypothetical protein
MFQTVCSDVRYSVRLLRRAPGFALTAIVTLALAIGANAAVFSAVKGVLVAPLPSPSLISNSSRVSRQIACRGMGMAFAWLLPRDSVIRPAAP